MGTPAALRRFGKKPPKTGGFELYGWDGWARTSEMPESKSGALPLGYIPITLYHFTTGQGRCQ